MIETLYCFNLEESLYQLFLIQAFFNSGENFRISSELNIMFTLFLIQDLFCFKYF